MTSLWLRFLALPLWARIVIAVFAWPVPLALWAATRPDGRRVGPALLAVVATAFWVAIPLASPSSPDDRNRAGVTALGDVAAPPADSPTATTVPTAGSPAESTTTSTAGGAAGGPSSSGPVPVAPAGVKGGPAATTATTQRPVTTTTTSPAGDPTAILVGLRVAPEGARAGYDRELFPHWVDGDGDRCDTREEVLIAESRSAAQVDPYGCKVVAGDWVSLYDGLTFSDPGELDIDHMVALAEAWDSGASAWDTARRRAFANDLDHPQALRAVSASSNRSKSDLDPGQWKPTRDSAWCEYARDWVTVKKAWDLTADQNEVDDLRVMLRTCTAPLPETRTTPPPTAAPTTTSTTTGPPVTGGAVTVTALDCGAEAVVVGNGGGAPADLTGWSLHDAGAIHTFRFPAGYTLAPGASVTIRSGGPAGPGELGWTGQNVWNNTGDTASLRNAGGGVVSTRSCS